VRTPGGIRRRAGRRSTDGAGEADIPRHLAYRAGNQRLKPTLGAPNMIRTGCSTGGSKQTRTADPLLVRQVL
jgi:hypothetical protein